MVGLGFRVHGFGLGFRVWDLGLRAASMERKNEWKGTWRRRYHRGLCIAYALLVSEGFDGLWASGLGLVFGGWGT